MIERVWTHGDGRGRQFAAYELKLLHLIVLADVVNEPIKVSRGAEIVVLGTMPKSVGQKLHDLAIIARAEMPHAIGINYVDAPLFTRSGGQGCTGNEEQSCGPEIEVVLREMLLIKRSEVIADRQTLAVGSRIGTIASELHDGIAVVGAVRVHIKSPVAGDCIDVAGRICRQAGPGMPDRTVNSGRSNGPVHHLLQGRSVMSHDPTVIRPVITMGSECDVNDAIQQQ